MRKRGARLAELYAAADRFREDCLRSDGSLFTPASLIWTIDNLDDLLRRFVEQPDESKDPFMVKFERQLSDAPPSVVQLATEAFYVHLLVAGNIGASHKRQLVQTTGSWGAAQVALPPELDAAFEANLAHAGTAFNTLRPFQVGYLLRFVRLWKTLSREQVDQGLNDPWAFKRALHEVAVDGGAYAQREALLHLVHPDAFEPILLRTIKREIVSAFADEATADSDDVDRQLAAIRDALTPQYGEGFNFYEPEIAAIWRAEATGQATRYVKVAPGEAAKWWSECLAGGYIAVGWDDVGDLRAFGSKDAFRERFGELYPYGGNRGHATRKANEVWTLGELKPGDVIVANRGESEVLAVGTVLEPGYDWLPERDEGKHIVHVDWDTSKARSIPPIGAWKTRTVMDLNKEQVREFVIGRPPPALTDQDFAVLRRHQGGKPWTEIPHADQTVLGLLRKKVHEYALHFHQQLRTDVELVPFVSILNPNGRSPSIYWSCVYPEPAGNKSYAFQLFLIVSPDGVEYGFGAGSGDSQVKDAARTSELAERFAAARSRLASTHGASWWPELDDQLQRSGFGYRHRWQDTAAPPVNDHEEWLSGATGADSRGAAISKALSPSEAVALGRRLAVEAAREMAPLVRLMDATYRNVGTRPAATLSDLAISLSLQPEYLEDVRWLLEDQRQIVFYGPPGTGKTYVAEAFAEWFTGDPNRVEVIQFHPSYAYEDFVEGIRPDLDGDGLRYRLVPGVLRRFAQRADTDPERHVLIVDEINRANLARVFGELLYLLEYRDKSVTLPYSQERFSLPANLYIIGTMNSADRSVALVDFALRRRFHFVEFPADEEILRGWLSTHRSDMTHVADYLGYVNDELGRTDFQVGFSYFMRTDLDEELLDRIWARSVLPALEEFFYSDPSRASRFRLKEIRSALAVGDETTENASSPDPDSDEAVLSDGEG